MAWGHAVAFDQHFVLRVPAASNLVLQVQLSKFCWHVTAGQVALPCWQLLQQVCKP